MFKCHVCGNGAARTEFVSEMFVADGRRVLVAHIPAEVCTRCGEAMFSRATTEQIRQVRSRSEKPLKTVPLDVFALTHGRVIQIHWPDFTTGNS